MLMLKPGDQAIDFNMQIDDGSYITLNSFPNRNIVLYFYPKDDTPGCTIEAIDFTTQKQAFEDLLSKSKTSFHLLGTVTEGDLLVDGELFGDVSTYKQKFNSSLTKKMS